MRFEATSESAYNARPKFDSVKSRETTRPNISLIAKRIEELLETADREKALTLFIDNIWSNPNGLHDADGEKIFNCIRAEIDEATYEKPDLSSAYYQAFVNIFDVKYGKIERIRHAIDLIYILLIDAGDEGYAAGALREPLRDYIRNPQANYLASLQASESLRQDDIFLVDHLEERHLPLKDNKVIIGNLGRVFVLDQEDVPAFNLVLKSRQPLEGRLNRRKLDAITSLREVDVTDLLIDSERQTGQEESLREEARQFAYLLHPYILRGLESDFADLDSDDRWNDVFDEMRTKSREKTYLRIRDLSPRELFYFIRFLNTQTNEEAGRFKTFARKFGASGLKSFLATGYDLDFSDHILKIAEILPEDTARAIFSKYDEIVEAADQAAIYISKNIKAKPDAHVLSEKAVYAQLMRHGKGLLSGIIRKDQQVDTKKFIGKLANVKTDILLFAATFKAVKDSGSQIELQDIAGTEIQTLSPTELSLRDKEKMVVLYEQVRADFSEEHRELRLQGFKDLLNSSEGRFYVLRHNDEIISFVHFKDLPNGNVYGGSFSVLSDVRGEKLGNALLQSALNQENRTKTVEAVVDAGNASLINYYTKTLHHQLTGEEVMVGSTKYLKMIRPAQKPIEFSEHSEAA